MKSTFTEKKKKETSHNKSLLKGKKNEREKANVKSVFI